MVIILKKYFDDKDVGYVDAIKCSLEGVDVEIHCLKEPDYVMMLMSSYGTLERVRAEKKRIWTPISELMLQLRSTSSTHSVSPQSFSVLRFSGYTQWKKNSPWKRPGRPLGGLARYFHFYLLLLRLIVVWYKPSSTTSQIYPNKTSESSLQRS